jgi:IS5 family transposase
MRQIIQQQIPIVHLHVEHEHGFELAIMSHVLDQEPRVAELVFKDLTRHGAKIDTGRDAMTAEQVLRALIVKQMNGFSYKELAFHLADSRSYKTFCRFGINDKPPSKATLQRNIKKVRAETLEEINRILVLHANAEGIERGRKVRVDCTGVETNIHSPSDSSLLWDCVRVLTRNMHLAGELADFTFTDHSRRAKRRYIGIRSAKRKKRVKLYRDLLKVTRETVLSAERAIEVLKKLEGINVLNVLSALGLADELEHIVELAYRVISQTERRVLKGENVPSGEKIVSIFEPHTDIIKKDRGDPLYGHKLCLTSGASGIVTDCVIEDGNPADSKLAVNMIERQIALYRKPTRQASFDGGFASKSNLRAIKDMGVEDVVFSKRRGLNISDMAKSCWVYKRLRDFRAGIEGVISFLKRCFGLSRCTWRGLQSFKAYTWSSIVSANLLLIARHMLS